jgi:ribonuclease P protein component
MLPKKYRLKKSGDIKSVLRLGRTVREGFLILKTRENNLSSFRFAFLISLKVSKKATVRNRLRRRLSEFIRLNLSDIERSSSALDAVLIVVSDFSGKNSQEAGELINRLFSRAKIVGRSMK